MNAEKTQAKVGPHTNEAYVQDQGSSALSNEHAPAFYKETRTASRAPRFALRLATSSPSAPAQACCSGGKLPLGFPHLYALLMEKTCQTCNQGPERSSQVHPARPCRVTLVAQQFLFNWENLVCSKRAQCASLQTQSLHKRTISSRAGPSAPAALHLRPPIPVGPPLRQTTLPSELLPPSVLPGSLNLSISEGQKQANMRISTETSANVGRATHKSSPLQGHPVTQPQQNGFHT